MFENTRGGFMRGNTLSGRRKMFGWTAVAFIAAVIILCGTIHILPVLVTAGLITSIIPASGLRRVTLSGALPIDILPTVR